MVCMAFLEAEKAGQVSLSGFFDLTGGWRLETVAMIYIMPPIPPCTALRQSLFVVVWNWWRRALLRRLFLEHILGPCLFGVTSFQRLGNPFQWNFHVIGDGTMKVIVKMLEIADCCTEPISKCQRLISNRPPWRESASNSKLPSPVRKMLKCDT